MSDNPGLDLALGQMGVATGSAMNAAGLMYHGAAHDAAKGASAPNAAPARPPCKATEARWDAHSECFQPTQVHVNALVMSLWLNAALIVVVVVLAAIFRKARGEEAS